MLNSLAGQDQLLRERVIGAEVFKRTPDYDPSDDPIVRSRASEVRKRLAQFYQGVDRDAVVRIDIPAGSYRATFEWAQVGGEQKLVMPARDTQAFESSGPEIARPLETISPLRQPSLPPSGRKWKWLALPILLIVLALAAIAWKFPKSSESDFARFWAPLLSSPKPVLVCMGSNAVYRLSDDFLEKYREDHHLDNHGVDFYVNWAPDEQVDSRNILKAWNSFVALGDVAALSEIAVALTRQGKSFQERFPPDVSFAELQNTPAVLIGGFNNYMTITMTKDLRFRLGSNGRIEDQQNSKISWAVTSARDSHDTEDYAIVSRLLDSKTGAPVISVAGIGGYGTQAAAAFIGNPQMIAQLAKTAPKRWEQKNLQLVLHVKVVDYRPISTDVVSTYYW